MNGIHLTTVGNLTRDVELRFTPAGQPVASFTIAVTPRSKDKRTGEWVDGQTTFLDCQAWGLPAENIAESLARGTRVIVAGTLGTERWQDKTTGEDRERLRLTVDEIAPSLRFVTAKVSKTSRQSTGQGQPDAGEPDPWARAQGTVAQQLGGHTVPAADAPF